MSVEPRSPVHMATWLEHHLAKDLGVAPDEAEAIAAHWLRDVWRIDMMDEETLHALQGRLAGAPPINPYACPVDELYDALESLGAAPEDICLIVTARDLVGVALPHVAAKARAVVDICFAS